MAVFFIIDISYFLNDHIALSDIPYFCVRFLVFTVTVAISFLQICTSMSAHV